MSPCPQACVWACPRHRRPFRAGADDADPAAGRLVGEADMTMRAFVLDALKAKGVAVRPDDLMDLRKESTLS